MRSRVLRWWSQTSAIPETPFHTASFYLVPLLLLLAVGMGDYRLKPVAAVVCVFGIIETIRVYLYLEGRTAAKARGVAGRSHFDQFLFHGLFLIVLALHVLVYVPYWCKSGGDLWLSLGVLLLVAAVFFAMDTWPYNMSPLMSSVFVLMVMMTDALSCES